MADAPTPNWRDNEGNPSESAGNKPWQPKDSAAADPSSVSSRRGLKRGVALVALLGLAVGIGVVVWMLRPIKPACLVLIGSGYETNLLLPHNVFGWNGLGLLDKDVTQEDKAIGGFFERSTKMRRVGDRVEVKDQAWKDLWKDIHDKIEGGSAKEETVVVFISLHGIANKDEAYLLPNKQSVKGFNQARIPFKDVLDSLKSVKKKKILLLLDVAQAPAEWSIGVLHNDFVQRLQDTYDAKIKEAGNLTVICSSSPDQRSWASAELQNSIFAHYVAEALKGAAGQAANEPVTAWSLFKYVEENVDKWAQTNRARKQTPVLLGEQKLAENTRLVLVPEAYKKPDAPPVRTLESDSLKTEWSKWKTLKEQNAFIYAPHIWRLYQETLVRYEQLQRAGDPTNQAEELKKRLAKIYAQIAVGPALDKAYACLGNSFPIQHTLGYRVTKDDLRDPALIAFLTSLRKADTAEEKNALLAKFREKSPLEKQYLQARLSQLILKDADRPGKFDRAAEQKWLTDIEKELRAPQRPAEAHLLRMLQDADSDLDGEDIRLALRVRALAEGAALSASSAPELYSEVIFPWIQERVLKADKLRREGEDLLFGDPKVHAVEGSRKLKESQKQYTSVRDEARQLQKALALRDELSADLPFLAAWLAALPPDAKQGKQKIQDLEDLGDRLADLNRSIEVDKKIMRPEELDKIAADTRSMREEYQNSCVGLRQGIVLQQNWHALDAALSIPPMDFRDDDVALRLALLTRIRYISGELFNSKDLEGKAEKDDASHTERQRKLLRACLRSFDIPDKDRESLDYKARDFFLKLPQDILAKSEGPTDDTKLDDVVAELASAANLCRSVPGALAEQVKGEGGELLNPVDRLRRVRTIRLLNGLARRTLEDHWFGPGNEVYYLFAGRAYLDGARALYDKGLMSKKLIKEVDDTQSKYVLADLKILKRPDPYWTTEYDFPLAWQVQADDALVEKGTPMVWVEVKKGAKAEKAWQPSPRKPINVWPAKKPYDDPFRLNKSHLFDDGDVTVTFNAIYRGQHLTDPLMLLRSPPKVIVRNFPAPEKAALAVRMDSAFDYGAISIVLDNSGSMRWAYPVGKKEDVERVADRSKKEKRRFDYALDALKHVLLTIPDNTELSIFALGQTVDKKATNRPTLIKPPAPWRKSRLDDLLADLDDLPGDFSSPIAEGIIDAMNKGFSPNFKGPRVVLVLTDGDDNLSYREEEPRNEKESAAHTEKVVEALKAANANDPFGTSVVVVCFIQPEGFDKKGERVANPEFARAKAQFEGVASFKPYGSGQLKMVPDGKELGTAIEAIVRPRVMLKVGGEPAAGFNGGATINYHRDQAIQWRTVTPNNYQASILKTGSADFAIDLPRGQNIFAVLKNKGGKAFLERGILARQPEATKRGIESRQVLTGASGQGGWLVSLLENHNHLSNKLTEMVAFESLDLEGPIRQVHPGFAWLELDSMDGKKPDQTLTWTRDWRVPALAYQLEMPSWPLRCNPKLTAWFAPDARANFLVNDNLAAHITLPIPFDDAKGSAAMLDAKARIESVLWASFEVDSPAGGKTKENCLVVRVRHAKGKPVWIGLKKAGAEVGSEHHFFADASGCTAYFYKLKKIEEADIFLVDIEAFKAAATRVVFTPEGTIRPPEMFLNRLE